MNENRWTKIFIKIKTTDNLKCSQKISWEGGRGGGNFHGGKLTPENASQENCPPEVCPPSPQKNILPGKTPLRKLSLEKVAEKTKKINP